MNKRPDNVIQFKKDYTRYVVGVAVAVIVIMIIVLVTCFKIDEIKVTGNKHYSKEQIENFVLDNGYVNNSVLLMIKNKIRPIKDIPFIAKLDIEYNSAHSITITVYEKAMAGCIEYMNEYVYFDQDGYVLEISPAKLKDTPCITGMSFGSMELHEKLPIEDKKRFKLILKMTQLLQKYNLHVTSIKFTSDNELVMQYENIRIELGDGSNLEEQLIDLNQILEGVKGKKGTLDLKEFDASNGKASFKLDNEKKKTSNNLAKEKQDTTEGNNENQNGEHSSETVGNSTNGENPAQVTE